MEKLEEIKNLISDNKIEEAKILLEEMPNTEENKEEREALLNGAFDFAIKKGNKDAVALLVSFGVKITDKIIDEAKKYRVRFDYEKESVKVEEMNVDTDLNKYYYAYPEIIKYLEKAKKAQKRDETNKKIRKKFSGLLKIKGIFKFGKKENSEVNEAGEPVEKTIFDYAAESKGKLSTYFKVKKLLKNTSSGEMQKKLELKTKDNKTLLSLAAGNGRYFLSKLFVKFGAKVSQDEIDQVATKHKRLLNFLRKTKTEQEESEVITETTEENVKGTTEENVEETAVKENNDLNK